MASEIMYDSVTDVPPWATLILAYIDGLYNNFTRIRTEHPTAVVVPTTTSIVGLLTAQVYDCEKGDGNATQAADWARRKLAIHQRPTIYCSRLGTPGYGWQWVKSALIAAGIPLSAVDFGIADYTGVPHLLPGTVFTQYANPTYTGANYDKSITNGIWPSTNPPPPGDEHVTSSVTQVNGVTQLHVFDNQNGQRVHWWQDLANTTGQNLGVWHVELLPAVP